MSASLVIRSFIALMVSVSVASFALTRASVPPRSAYQELSNSAVDPIAPIIDPRQNLAPGAAPTPTPAPTLGQGLHIDSLPYVPGYIIYTTEHHNIDFVTGHLTPWGLRGDGSSVAPALSPDGKSLAWVDTWKDYSDVFVAPLRINANNQRLTVGNQTQLTQDQNPPPALQRATPVPQYNAQTGTYQAPYDPRYWWWATKPSWTPDGKHLLYTSDRPGFDGNDGSTATAAIWEQGVGVTGTITNAVQMSTPTLGTGGDDSPEWRPRDPNVFLYVDYTYLGTNQQTQSGVIKAAMAPGYAQAPTSTRDLTPPTKTMFEPAWSPASYDIAFIEDVPDPTGKGQNKTVLKVMAYHRPGYLGDYYNAKTVVVGQPYVAQPFWSPDGKWLGYLTSSGDAFQLVIRRVMGQPRHLTFGKPITIFQARDISAEYRPAWLQPHS